MHYTKASQTCAKIRRQFSQVSIIMDETETGKLYNELFGKQYEVIVSVKQNDNGVSPLTVAKFVAWDLTNGRDWIDAITFEHADIFNVRNQVYVSWKR